MTAYNRASFIASSIESVLAQTFAGFELIIVDDCSTDGTLDIARQYERLDPRVRVVVNERNLGDYGNRNHAATFVSAPLFKYHDSDDLMYPHCLQVMVSMMDAEPRAGFAINVRHGVIVVKHHGVEAKFFKLIEFPIERLRRARGGAVGVLAFAEVPRAEAEFVLVLFWHRRFECGTL